MIIEYQNELRSLETADLKKHSNISLNGLLKWYLNIDNFVKDEVRPLMQNNIYFWMKVILFII